MRVAVCDIEASLLDDSLGFTQMTAELSSELEVEQRELFGQI